MWFGVEFVATSVSHYGNIIMDTESMRVSMLKVLGGGIHVSSQST